MGTVILRSPVLGYFNSLRELGRSRRIVEDEVNARIGRHRRADEEEGSFPNRDIDSDFPPTQLSDADTPGYCAANGAVTASDRLELSKYVPTHLQSQVRTEFEHLATLKMYESLSSCQVCNR